MLVEYANESAQLGYPKTHHDICQAASDLTKIFNKPGFRQELPSRNWMERFLKTHPTTLLRFAKDEINYDGFHAKFLAFLKSRELEEILNRKDAFYIIEDTNLDLNDKPPNCDRRNQLKKVLAKKIQSEIHRFRSKESATVTYTFSAQGKMMQPLMIFRNGTVDMMKIAIADQGEEKIKKIKKF